jgi:cytochrome oxidase Cu insertion factor (SCO1/SenC/PrrC family)
MKLGPRAKLLLLALLFLAPIAASFTAYYIVRPSGGSSYGELLLPPATVTAQTFARAGGGRFRFTDFAGKWVLVAAEPGECAAACLEKLATLRQVRIALGVRASRVERAFVTGRGNADPRLLEFPGMVVAVPLPDTPTPAGALADRDHIHLVDPHGNVMMRWPSQPDRKRMLKDLERLLRASQIG